MRLNRQITQLSALVVLGASASVGMAAFAPEVMPAHHVGEVTYLDIDGRAVERGVLKQKVAASYPLEIDFLWGRGAKQSEVDGVKWTIANAAGRTLVTAPPSGPVVLAALPDGRYTVTGWYEGTPSKRTVTVHYGEHSTVPLEWGQ